MATRSELIEAIIKRHRSSGWADKQRLMDADPSRFRTRSLRMVQRVAKAWRADVRGRIILDGDWIKQVHAYPSAAEGEIVRSITTPSNSLR